MLIERQGFHWTELAPSASGECPGIGLPDPGILFALLSAQSDAGDGCCTPATGPSFPQDTESIDTDLIVATLLMAVGHLQREFIQ